jgi:hypothetical protein
MEFWCLMDWLITDTEKKIWIHESFILRANPGCLGDEEKFKRKFQGPIIKGQKQDCKIKTFVYFSARSTVCYYLF